MWRKAKWWRAALMKIIVVINGNDNNGVIDNIVGVSAGRHRKYGGIKYQAIAAASAWRENMAMKNSAVISARNLNNNGMAAWRNQWRGMNMRNNKLAA